MGGSKNEDIPSALAQRQKTQRQLQPVGSPKLEHSKKAEYQHAQVSEVSTQIKSG